MRLETKLIAFVSIGMFSCTNTPTGDKNSSESATIEQESISPDPVQQKGELDDIELYDKTLIGKIETTGGDWLIISGVSCTECDENPSIYLYPVTDEKITTAGVDKYSYPGKVYYYEDNSLLFEARTFWGNCSESGNQVIYWLQKELMENGEWQSSAYLVEFTAEGKQDKRIESTANLLEQILLKVSQGECHEIPGTERTSEP